MLSVVDSDADDVTEVSCDETGLETVLPAQPLSRETRIKVHIKVVFFHRITPFELANLKIGRILINVINSYHLFN